MSSKQQKIIDTLLAALELLLENYEDVCDFGLPFHLTDPENCVEVMQARAAIALAKGAKVSATGVAYFPTFEAARDFGGKHGRGFHAWQAVWCSQPAVWAVQCMPGGAYFGPDGRLAGDDPN